MVRQFYPVRSATGCTHFPFLALTNISPSTKKQRAAFARFGCMHACMDLKNALRSSFDPNT